MNLNMQIPDGSAPNPKAEADDISSGRLTGSALQTSLTVASEQQPAGQPFETGYGIWAKYAPAPSAEEIDENRREMFSNFAEDV